jgi:hypothetical protein
MKYDLVLSQELFVEAMSDAEPPERAQLFSKVSGRRTPFSRIGGIGQLLRWEQSHLRPAAHLKQFFRSGEYSFNETLANVQMEVADDQIGLICNRFARGLADAEFTVNELRADTIKLFPEVHCCPVKRTSGICVSFMLNEFRDHEHVTQLKRAGGAGQMGPKCPHEQGQTDLYPNHRLPPPTAI